MNYKIKKAFANYKVGEVEDYDCKDRRERIVLALLEHCGFIEPITEWSADKFKDGEEYYYVSDDGKVYLDKFYGEPEDTFRLKSKNIYRTKEEAEEAYKRIMNS